MALAVALPFPSDLGCCTCTWLLFPPARCRIWKQSCWRNLRYLPRSVRERYESYQLGESRALPPMEGASRHYHDETSESMFWCEVCCNDTNADRCQACCIPFFSRCEECRTPFVFRCNACSRTCTPCDRCKTCLGSCCARLGGATLSLKMDCKGACSRALSTLPCSTRCSHLCPIFCGSYICSAEDIKARCGFEAMMFCMAMYCWAGGCLWAADTAKPKPRQCRIAIQPLQAPTQQTMGNDPGPEKLGSTAGQWSEESSTKALVTGSAVRYKISSRGCGRTWTDLCRISHCGNRFAESLGYGIERDGAGRSVLRRGCRAYEWCGKVQAGLEDVAHDVVFQLALRRRRSATFGAANKSQQPFCVKKGNFFDGADCVLEFGGAKEVVAFFQGGTTIASGWHPLHGVRIIKSSEDFAEPPSHVWLWCGEKHQHLDDKAYNKCSSSADPDSTDPLGLPVYNGLYHRDADDTDFHRAAGVSFARFPAGVDPNSSKDPADPTGIGRTFVGPFVKPSSILVSHRFQGAPKFDHILGVPVSYSQCTAYTPKIDPACCDACAATAATDPSSDERAAPLGSWECQLRYRVSPQNFVVARAQNSRMSCWKKCRVSTCRGSSGRSSRSRRVLGHSFLWVAPQSEMIPTRSSSCFAQRDSAGLIFSESRRGSRRGFRRG